MAYGAPLWGSVSAELTSGYSAPTFDGISVVVTDTGLYAWRPPLYGAVSVELASGYTSPSFDGTSVTLSRTPVGGSDTYVYLNGLLSQLAFGTPAALGPRSLYPSGWASSGIGAAYLELAAQGVLAGGIAPPPQTGPNSGRQVPDPFVDFRVRETYPSGIAAPANQLTTTHIVAFYTQFLDLASHGVDSFSSGSATVEFAVRYVQPLYISSNVFGQALIARVQLVSVSGWDSSFVSENHEFDINLQRVYHHSGASDPAGYGGLSARNAFENVYPTGWSGTALSFPVVYNHTQQLFVQPFMGTNDDPTQWPNYYPFVENRTRVLGPSGWQSSRFSLIGNEVRNSAAPLGPPGLDATIWGPTTFIAYRIRTVAPEPWDGFYTSRYAVVYNAAAVLAPTSWASSRFGVPSQVANLNRTVRHVFPYDGETFGLAFVAPRVRYVVPGLFYDVPSGFPEVRFDPYPLAPTGIAPRQFGGATVYEHFTIAYPRSANVHDVPWVGGPIVENRNKTLRVFPSDQSLYGLARVTNRNTHLFVGAGVQTLFGSQLVGYRTRTVAPAPISVPAFSALHRIQKDTPDPPGLQRVAPDGLFLGDSTYPGVIPPPLLRLATIYPLGFTASAVGMATLSRNTIQLTRSIFDLDQLGTPVLSATQFAYVKSIPDSATVPSPGDSDLDWPRPRVSPHTIYAPSADQATEQAKNNHPFNTPHVVGGRESDGEWSEGGGFPWFGRPDVSNYFRSIYPTGAILGGPWSSRVGDPNVSLKDRTIYPVTVRATRFGIVIFLGVEQRVSLASRGLLSEEIGDATISHPAAEPQLSVPGFDASLFGANRIELFIRTLFVEGIPHRGNPQQDLTNPWGLPLVGYPRQYVLGGDVFTLWGTTWVSHKNRTLPAQGWNSSTLEDEDIDSFSERMRVSRRNPSDGVHGIASTSVVGHPTVTHFARYVIGRGVAGYAAGLPSLQSKCYLRPSGWASSVIGDVDRWEAGKVKAYGDELGAVGYPRLLHPIRLLSADSFASGTHAAGRRVSVAGLPPIGFAGPSVSNPFGCNNRVVVPLPILSQQNVPNPVVTR